MSNSLARAPWQVVLACGALITLGAGFGASSLMRISEKGDRAGIEANLENYQSVSVFDGFTTSDIWEWLELAASVFAIAATVLILLGVLLWQGVARPGVRLTATITTAIALLASLIPAIEGLRQQSAVGEDARIFMSSVAGAALISCLLLWMPSVKSWIRETPGESQ